jgi:hypothetical protein
MGDFKYPSLGVVEFEDPTEQVRPDLAGRGSHRMTRSPLQVPEQDRARLTSETLNTDLGNALLDLLVVDSGHC